MRHVCSYSDALTWVELSPMKLMMLLPNTMVDIVAVGLRQA